MKFASSTKKLFAGMVVMAATHSVNAAGYPVKPIELVVPYSAGDTTDQLARKIQQPMSEVLGQPIVIVNKPGAGGAIGADYVARAKPDGYTLVFGNTGPNAIISLIRDVPYDTVKDFQPISTVVITPMILAASANSPIKNFKEFVTYVKNPENKVNYGSTGIAGLSHMVSEYFKDFAGINMLHVPYAGAAPMLPAFKGGQLDVAFLTGLDGKNMLAAEAVKYLAIATKERSKVFPDLPTISEELPGFEAESWFGVLAPKGIPEDVLKKLNEAVASAVNTPSVNKFFVDSGVIPESSTPEEHGQRIKKEIEQWTPVVNKLNIKQ